MPSDAAFREAVGAYAKEAVNVFEARRMKHPETDKWEVALNRAEARVLALYAERQGEVYVVGVETVTTIIGTYEHPIVHLHHERFKPGDRVRVVRVECWRDTAGRAHPKEKRMTPERERLVRAVEEAHAEWLVHENALRTALRDERPHVVGLKATNAYARESLAVAALAAYDAAHPTVTHCSGDLTLQPDHDEEPK